MLCVCTCVCLPMYEMRYVCVVYVCACVYLRVCVSVRDNVCMHVCMAVCP